MTLTINLPDELYRQASDAAAEAKISLEELIVSSCEHQLREVEQLKERALRGSHEKFLQVLEKVPDAEPPDYDRL